MAASKGIFWQMRKPFAMRAKEPARKMTAFQNLKLAAKITKNFGNHLLKLPGPFLVHLGRAGSLAFRHR
jgi:hypothetical protein